MTDGKILQLEIIIKSLIYYSVINNCTKYMNQIESQIQLPSPLIEQTTTPIMGIKVFTNNMQYQCTLHNYPPPTAYHSMVYYKNKLFIWGGKAASPADNHHLCLYFFDIQHSKWGRILTKNAQPGLQSLSSPANAIHNHKWYFFGGINRHQKYSNYLWKLNLDQFQWKKCDQKGDVPPPSEGGHLLFIDKNWILHYQGFNSENPSKSQFIYLYNVDTKIWHKCQGNYLHYVKFRIGTSICIQSDKIYMFGGVHQIEDQMQYLNDLYSLKVWLPSKNNPANIEAKLIRTSLQPSPTYQHFLLPFQSNLLIKFGGQKQEQIFLSKQIWIFNTKAEVWWKQNIAFGNRLERYGNGYAIGENNIYGFGGFSNRPLGEQEIIVDLMNDLWQITISDNYSKYLMEESLQTDTCNSCILCYEKRKNFAFGKRAFSKQTIDNLTQMIQFPFAAFGLLVDNALINNATSLQISIQNHQQQAYIKIQDQGKNDFTTDQFINSIVSLGSQHSEILLGCDKKTKKVVSRQNESRQFGANLSLGCLRLGKSFLYVSVFGDSVRVCLCQESKQQQTENIYYYIYYYEQIISKLKLASQEMKSSFLYIESQYKQHIKQITKWRITKNVLFIFNTILDNQIEQLRYHPQKNDIYYGKPEDIDKLIYMGYFVGQSIDISLKAYLSMLYLKHQKFTISIASKLQTLPIYIQANLEKVDKMARGGIAIELEGVIQFDFKLAEFYYLKDLRKHYAFFNNGVIFYHKNRLVARHRPPLGEMIPFILGETNEYRNILPLFGYAELCENISINPFKTDFSFSIMMERLISRIIFVQQYLRAKGNQNTCQEGRRLQRRKRRLFKKRNGQQDQRKGQQKIRQDKQIRFEDQQQKNDEQQICCMKPKTDLKL